MTAYDSLQIGDQLLLQNLNYNTLYTVTNKSADAERAQYDLSGYIAENSVYGYIQISSESTFETFPFDSTADNDDYLTFGSNVAPYPWLYTSWIGGVFTFFNQPGNVQTSYPNWVISKNGVKLMGPGDVVPDTAVTRRNAKYATATEDGTHRFRRMLALGYV